MYNVVAFSRTKHEAAVIRKVFKGEPEAYRYIVEQYQPMVYAVALAHTGNVYLADKVVVATLKDGFDRLVSLTDPKRLGMLLCTVAQGESEKLLSRRNANWNKPRSRQGEPPIDMKWVQSELLDPLNEELGSFSVQERKGILLNAFCGMNAKNIAFVLKIERKEAEEDLARTQENIEKALLKEVANTLEPEINNKERLVAIMTEVAGPFVAEKAAQVTRIGQPKKKVVPYVVAASLVIVVAIGGYFGYRAFFGGAPVPQPEVVANNVVDQPIEVVADPQPEPEPVQAAEGEAAVAVVPDSFTLEGRVVDKRFPQDGIPSLKVEAAGKEAETDFFGAFTISGVPKGSHSVRISYQGEVFPGNRGVSTDGDNKPIEIEVTDKVPARFLFQARVFDHNTKEVIPTFEVATCKDFPEMLQPYLMDLFRERTHPEGILNDRFVTLGDYTMYVRARGYAPYPLQFTIDENWDLNRVYDFPLYRSAALEASVFGPTEVSIAEASIMPRQGTFHGSVTGKFEYGHTDSMGRFSLYTLPIGVQSFIIHHLTHGTGRAIVELEPGKTTQVRIQLPRKGALTGDITLNKKPAKFLELRRRISGAGVDLTRNVIYLSPGQYEVNATPEPATFVASVSPGENDKWFERRQELEATVATEEPTWLDFNFASDTGVVEGNITLNGEAPRALFVEIIYNLKGNDKERIVYELGATSSFRLEGLPFGSGMLHTYMSPRAMTKTDFASARALMDHKEQEFVLSDSATVAKVEISL
jgi:DNA-directed RNA polymerase specialized sigma24 family protein